MKASGVGSGENATLPIPRPAAMPMAKDAALMVTVDRVAMPQGCCPARAKSTHAPAPNMVPSLAREVRPGVGSCELADGGHFRAVGVVEVE